MIRWAFIGMLKVYKLLVSPFLGNCCRFHPTCSDYCRDAIVKHGSFKGLCLAAIRLSKCHPFHPGGYDPVPEPKQRPARVARCSA